MSAAVAPERAPFRRSPPCKYLFSDRLNLAYGDDQESRDEVRREEQVPSGSSPKTGNRGPCRNRHAIFRETRGKSPVSFG